MGQIHIQAKQPQFRLSFQATPPKAQQGDSAAAAQSAGIQDQLRLSGRQSESAPPASIELFDNKPKAASQQFMERLTTRQSSFNVVDLKQVQLEVGTESAAPELLTSSKEPDPNQELQQKLQNMGKSSGEQVIRTGAVIHPGENLQIQVGMASAVDTSRLLEAKSEEDKIKPGVYAGLAVRNEVVSGRVAVDTAFGRPRVEVGTAINAGDVATVGFSYLQTADEQQRTLRLGTEVKAGQDTVVGLNLNQPLHQATQVNGNTAVGFYLNTKFN